MSEFTMDRLRENLEALKMRNTLEILDNYLERAVAENLNIVEVLNHIFSEEAKYKRRRAYEKPIRMSGFPSKKTLDDFDFSFQQDLLPVERGLRRRRHCLRHSGPRSASLHLNIKDESYRLKGYKEFMRQKQQIVNTLFAQDST